MTEQNGPRYLLVCAKGDISPIYSAAGGAYADIEEFTENIELDDASLNLPSGLSDELRSWSQNRPSGGFRGRPELRKHVKKGLEVTRGLAKHLGPAGVVRYWDERHETAKFVCWGCLRLHWTIDAHGNPPHPVDITVEGEYKYWPLRAENFGDFAPDDPAAGLDLSDDLVADLYKWTAEINENMELYLEERNKENDLARRQVLDQQGEELAERLAAEVSPGRTVTYEGLI